MKRLLRDSQGMALVTAIFVASMLLTITGYGLLLSGLGLRITSHYKTGVMAFFATEAGLQHAWRELENADGENAFDKIHGRPKDFSIVSNEDFSGTAYRVTLLESINNPRMIRVVSVGTAPNNSQARLEVWLRRDLGRARRALTTNGDLKLNGNPKFRGRQGGAHANDDMQVSGNPDVQMADGLTASNSVSGGGSLSEGMNISGNPCIGSLECGSNPPPNEYVLKTNEVKDAYEASHNSAPVYTIPAINPARYESAVAESSAGYILKADCEVVTRGVTSASVPSGWSCSSGTWKVSGNSAADGVFFTEGRIEISGNPGSPSSPWQATLIARDSVKISGNPSISPFPAPSEGLQNVLILTGNDLEISGNSQIATLQGGIFAHQQVKISGNPDIRGFIMAGDGKPTWAEDPFPETSPGVTINEVSGNPTITYNDLGVGLLPPSVTQAGWYQGF